MREQGLLFGPDKPISIISETFRGWLPFPWSDRCANLWRALCVLAAILLAVLCFAVPVIALPLVGQVALVVAPIAIMVFDRFAAHLKFDEIPFWEKALYYGLVFAGLVVLIIAMFGVGPLVIPGISLGVEELCIVVASLVGLVGLALGLDRLSDANQQLVFGVFFALLAAGLLVFAIATHGVGLLVLPKLFAPWLKWGPNIAVASFTAVVSAWQCYRCVRGYFNVKRRVKGAKAERAEQMAKLRAANEKKKKPVDGPEASPPVARRASQPRVSTNKDGGRSVPTGAEPVAVGSLFTAAQVADILTSREGSGGVAETTFPELPEATAPYVEDPGVLEHLATLGWWALGYVDDSAADVDDAASDADFRSAKGSGRGSVYGDALPFGEDDDEVHSIASQL